MSTFLSSDNSICWFQMLDNIWSTREHSKTTILTELSMSYLQWSWDRLRARGCYLLMQVQLKVVPWSAAMWHRNGPIKILILTSQNHYVSSVSLGERRRQSWSGSKERLKQCCVREVIISKKMVRAQKVAGLMFREALTVNCSTKYILRKEWVMEESLKRRFEPSRWSQRDALGGRLG